MEKHTNEVEDNQMRALSWKTRVSYGLGDTACNVVYGMIGSLLTIFILIMLESVQQRLV